MKSWIHSPNEEAYRELRKLVEFIITRKDHEMFESKTGAKRSERVVRYDLVPKSFNYRVAKRFTGDSPEQGGALKYGECNWERGLVTSDTINHIFDHLNNYTDFFRECLKLYEGNMLKVAEALRSFSSREDHLAGAAFGIAVLMHQESILTMHHDDQFKKPEGFAVINQTADTQAAQGLGYSDTYVEDLQRENKTLRDLAYKLEEELNAKHRRASRRKIVLSNSRNKRNRSSK